MLRRLPAVGFVLPVPPDILDHDSGSPVDGVSGDAVREQLARILASKTFNSAPVLSQMLRYVVERTLEGKIDELKEYSLGVDIFGRGDSFDPRADTIVRVQARRLRSKLEEYYNHEGRMDPVLVELPKGRYIASFRRLAPAPTGPPTLESTVGPAVLPLGERLAPGRLQVLLGGLAILAVVATGLLLYRGTRAKSTGEPAVKSLAVLPLKNLTGDPSQEYLADGMTEGIIGRLSMIRGLRVISRTSVMRFKDTRLSVPEIASSLHVDAIVEGSVIREGGRVRVHAQLIRGATDEHFWSETYDRELRDVLSLQSDVAQSIATKVEVTVTGKELARLVASHPVEPEVYESYLKGAEQLRRSNNRAEIEKSIPLFEEAIRKDASFAPAYLGLAAAYDDLGTVLVGVPPNETRPKLINAARKALSLDPELAEAHAYLAETYQDDWRWQEAEAEYKRALDLKPNDVASNLGYGDWLLCQGRIDEAVAWSRRTRELDPLEVRGANVGWALFNARRYDEAIRELRGVLAVHPDYAGARWFLGFALIGKGQPQEAIPELEKTVSIMHRSPGSLELLATGYARAGHRAEALHLINELKRRRQSSYVPAATFINPYLGLRDYDQAFVWFERAYQERSAVLQFLKVHPFFDPVRQDPRFRDLVHRVGLDQAR